MIRERGIAERLRDRWVHGGDPLILEASRRIDVMAATLRVLANYDDYFVANMARDALTSKPHEDNAG
jgi:hypothetical protein